MPRILSLMRRSVRTALRRRDGAVALEFALLATPFVFMLFAIIESGLIFITQIDLSNATMSLARQIRTGNVTAGGNASTTSGTSLSLNDFKATICKSLHFVQASTCTAQLQVDVRAQTVFGSGQTATTPIVNLNFNNSSLCYYSGQSGSIVEFRAFYLWPVFTPLVLNALINSTSYTVGSTTVSGKYHVVNSAEAFRIEQNSSSSNNGSGC